MNYPLKPIDFATLTVSDSAVSLEDATPAIDAGSTVRRALITIETDQIRWRDDGTAPTSSVGHLMEAGDVLDFTERNWETVLNKIQFIRVTTDATLSISYYD